MNRIPKGAVCVIAGLLTILVTGFGAEAQNREKFVISAKAGGVNLVDGRVLVQRAGQNKFEALTSQADLAAGDIVRTESSARAEVLLNPGAYLRAAEDTEFELADNSLENLRVRLIKGTAIVEAMGAKSTEWLINIVTPQTHFAIVRRGIYRITVGSGDTTELLVRKGRVVLGDDAAIVVKSGAKVIFSKGSFTTAKLNKKDQDGFDLWSKERAETLAQANSRMASTAFTGYAYGDLASSFYSERWGLWAYNPYLSCYTFFAFLNGWYSPYGPAYHYSPFFGFYQYHLGRHPRKAVNPPSTGGTPNGARPSRPRPRGTEPDWPRHPGNPGGAEPSRPRAPTPSSPPSSGSSGVRTPHGSRH